MRVWLLYLLDRILCFSISSRAFSRAPFRFDSTKEKSSLSRRSFGIWKRLLLTLWWVVCRLSEISLSHYMQSSFLLQSLVASYKVFVSVLPEQERQWIGPKRIQTEISGLDLQGYLWVDPLSPSLGLQMANKFSRWWYHNFSHFQWDSPRNERKIGRRRQRCETDFGFIWNWNQRWEGGFVCVESFIGTKGIGERWFLMCAWECRKTPMMKVPSLRPFISMISRLQESWVQNVRHEPWIEMIMWAWLVETALHWVNG